MLVPELEAVIKVAMDLSANEQKAIAISASRYIAVLEEHRTMTADERDQLRTLRRKAYNKRMLEMFARWEARDGISRSLDVPLICDLEHTQATAVVAHLQSVVARSEHDKALRDGAQALISALRKEGID